MIYISARFSPSLNESLFFRGVNSWSSVKSKKWNKKKHIKKQAFQEDKCRVMVNDIQLATRVDLLTNFPLVWVSRLARKGSALKPSTRGGIRWPTHDSDEPLLLRGQYVNRMGWILVVRSLFLFTLFLFILVQKERRKLFNTMCKCFNDARPGGLA